MKFVVPIGIIVYLAVAMGGEAFRDLREQPKNWPLLAIAFAMAMTAVCITFARWYLLVRALELPFTLRGAFRLGFLGFLLNFVSAGSVGGDLFKAVFIAHRHPGRRTEAVATVLIDRMFGLYALLAVASITILLAGLDNVSPKVTTLCQTVFMGTAVGGIAIVMMLVPGFTQGRLSQFFSGLPLVGPAIARLISAIRMYRSKSGALAAAGVMSLGVHCLFAVAIYLIAESLFSNVPTLVEHFVIVPLSLVAGALPLTPAGLGTFEGAFELLYRSVPLEPAAKGQGLVIALAYRTITIAIAAVGMVYYLAGRREVVEVLHEAELEMETERKQPVGVQALACGQKGKNRGTGIDQRKTTQAKNS